MPPQVDIDAEAKKDSLSPEEVVRRLANRPQDVREPKYQEACQHVSRWNALGLRLAALDEIGEPEDLLRKRYPGIEKTPYYRQVFGATSPSETETP